jgi:ribose-phosphate pyrophosphokinase
MSKQILDLFTGTANPELANEVAKILDIKISKADVGYFSDGEIKVQIEDNVRGHDTFILQSTCAPSNKNLMELMLLADALKAIVRIKNYSHCSLITVMQDKTEELDLQGVPISAKVVADMFYSVGIDRVLTVDLHSETIQGFFDMPADNVYATKLMVDDIKMNNPDNNIVVVSPDVGGVVRSRALAKQLNDADLAIIDKRRAAANQSEVMNIIGDIEDKVCIVPDDIIDTAGTLCNAAKALKDHGAAGVKAYITHPVLSGPAIERLNKSEIDELVVTNSIPLSHEGEKCSKIRVISLGATIAECIKRLSNEESLSEMFI